MSPMDNGEPLNRIRLTEREAVSLILLAGVAILGAHLGAVWMAPGFVRDRILLDSDSYMWLNRVLHLAGSGDWFNHRFPYVNPPDGHVQHWTRPFDGILLLGGMLFGWMHGMRDGLYFWSLSLTPLLHVASLGGLVWAVRPLMARGIIGARELPVLLLVFLVQIPVYLAFLIGRPDHHALMAFLFVLYQGFWLRVMLRGGGTLRAGLGMGLVGAASIWVSVEGLIFLLLGMVGLGLGWLVGSRDIARGAAVHGLALLVGVAAAVLVEWGPRAWSIREMDTLSMPHLALMAVVATFWVVLWRVLERPRAPGPWGRLAIGSVGVVGAFGVLFLTFPEFFGSPLANVDPFYAETRMYRIRELQPLTALGRDAWSRVGAVVLFAGPGAVVWFYLLACTLRSRAADERIVWGTFSVGVGLFLVMALNERRWSDYLALTAVIPFSVMAIHVLRLVARRHAEGPGRIGRPFALLGLVLWHVILGGTMMAAGGLPDSPAGELPDDIAWLEPDEAPAVRIEGRTVPGTGSTCDLVRVTEVLRDDAFFPEPTLILAHTDHGPELLFRTGHSVLSIPNHRHQPGYRYMHEVMADPDPRRAATLLSERGVGALVLCRDDLATGYFPYTRTQPSFATWLAAGGVPEGFSLHAASEFLRVYRADE